MTNDELRALADALEPMASLERSGSPGALSLELTIDYLRQCAEAQPVATLTLLDDMGAQIDFRQSFTLLPGQTFSLYTHPTPTVPDGWKLVPVEPTPEMLASTSWPGCAGTDYAHMLAAAPAAPQAEPKREPLSDERIAEIQRAAYERAAQECIETAAELRRCADGCTDGRYDWKADGVDDCADAIRALGRQHD